MAMPMLVPMLVPMPMPFLLLMLGPSHADASSRCYTPTEFALFGIGAVVMGVMLGVVGISWFKHQVIQLASLMSLLSTTMMVMSTVLQGTG